VEVLVIPNGNHSWLYEDPRYRRAVARFLSESLVGPLLPDDAADLAAAVDARRLPDSEPFFAAVTNAPGHLRTLGELSGAFRPAQPGD
jgi:hypothetical protein